MADQPKSFNLSPEIHEYVVAHGTPPDDVQRWLIDETKARVGAIAGMQIAPEQGTFMTLLTRLLDVRRAVEVGHLHRLLRAVHRAWPRPGWAAALL